MMPFGQVALVGSLITVTAVTLARPIPHAPSTRPTIALTSMVPGDTLSYKFSWGAGLGAVGYELKIYPIGGAMTGWSTLPVTPIRTTALTMAVRLINPTWDSTRFRIVIHSTKPGPTPGSLVLSKDSTLAEWSVIRLGPPGPIVIDSSLVVLGLRTVTVPVDAITMAICPVIEFWGGAESMRSQDALDACTVVERDLHHSPGQQRIADQLPLTFTATHHQGSALNRAQ